MYLVILSFFAVLFALLYIYSYVSFNYWKKRGVSGPTPRILVGNIGKSFIGKKSIGQIMTDIYNKYEDLPFVGIYRAMSPSLLVRDPEFIKSITVKDFNNFHDNDITIDKKVDPLFGKNPIVLKGDEWKTVRSLLTPCFTSGRMKAIYPLVEEVSNKMIKYLEKKLDGSKETGFELKELCSKFTIDNVASCAFGLEGKCFESENSHFRDLARRFISPGTGTAIKFIVMVMFPWLSKFITIKLVVKDVEEELVSIISETLKYRKENNIVRNDFLDAIGMPKYVDKPHFNDFEITAHCSSFFADGFETSSIVMSFVLFAVAENLHVQNMLREEITDSLKKSNGTVNYDNVHEIKYLEAVMQETLRKYPVIKFLSKTCTQKYTYTSGSHSVTVEPGTACIIPLDALSHDKNYFNDPEVFDPTRFLGENKMNEAKYVHLPFGEGPRSCLGRRFGLMQIKVGVVQIIQNYELRVNKKTQLPLKYDPLYFMISPVGGLWVNFYKLEKE